MRTHLLPLTALLALTVAWPAAAEEKKKADKPSKPTVVVRLASVDSLVADVRYLAELAGKGNEAEQAAAMLKSMSNEKGLAGIDTTRPIGLYGYLTPAGYDSEAVLLLPIVDEKEFTDKIEGFGMKPEKTEGGVWKLDVEKVPFPIFFKFANKYAYATLRDPGVLKKERLLDPATVLAGTGTVSAVVNLDEIPKELKEIALAQSELTLSNTKEKDMPGETKAQKDFRLAVLDETFFRFKELLTEGGPLSLHLNVDRKAGDLTLSAGLAGKPETNLAKGIAELGTVTSVAAGIVGKDAALSAHLAAALPVKLRKALSPVIEEAFQQAMEKEQDEAKRKLAEPILKVIAPTAKMGELDAGLSLIGPDSNGLYTILVGAKIKDGKALEQTLKDALKESPAKLQGSLSIDFAKAGDIGIHKAVPDKVDDNTRKLLGDNPVYFAFRDDALIVSGGPAGLETIKTAVLAAPVATKIFHGELAFSRAAKLLATEHKEAPAIAKEVFKGGDDTVRITLEGGSSLKLSVNVKAKLISFFAKIDEAKKK
jgi:hypothetical protein